MRHWVSGKTPGRADLILAESPAPTAGDGKMLVEVHAAALNFSDLLMIDDKYQVRPPRPFTPGQELAGVVVEAPASCGWKPGDRIASKIDWGGFAEYALVRPDVAMPVPDGLDLAHAAALPVIYTTAVVALHECADADPGSTVLVHAAGGGVGIASVEVARAAGARVLAAAGSRAKRDLALAHGAELAIDYSDPKWHHAVRQATGGAGADIIVDPVGGEVTQQSLRCIARDGTLLIVGFASGTIPQIPANRLLLKRAAAKGVYWNHDHDGEMLARASARIFEMLSKGAIDPVVDAGYGLEELPKALDDLGGRKVRGKAVLRVR